LLDQADDLQFLGSRVAEDEAKGKVGPNGTGCGKQCAEYLRASANYASLLGAVNERFEEFKQAKARAEILHANMTNLSSSDSTAAGQARFAGFAAELGRQIAAMDALTALPLIAQAGMIRVDTKNGVTTQRDTELTKELNDKVKRIKAERKPVPPVAYLTTSKAPATLDHPYAVPGAWLVGVAFDLLPLIMFLMMMLAYSEARTPHQPLPAFVRAGGRELDVAGPRLVQAAE
jgi:hypothetical protein